jgi:hypothetical protein
MINRVHTHLAVVAAVVAVVTVVALTVAAMGCFDVLGTGQRGPVRSGFGCHSPHGQRLRHDGAVRAPTPRRAANASRCYFSVGPHAALVVDACHFSAVTGVFLLSLFVQNYVLANILFWFTQMMDRH